LILTQLSAGGRNPSSASIDEPRVFGAHRLRDTKHERAPNASLMKNRNFGVPIRITGKFLSTWDQSILLLALQVVA